MLNCFILTLCSYEIMFNRCPYLSIVRLYCRQSTCQNVNTIFNIWRLRFIDSNIEEPEINLQNIFSHTLKLETVEDLKSNLNKQLNKEQVSKINKLCECKLARMPLQYIIGEWQFRDLTLKMVPPVFIPRPETELLVQIIKENAVELNTFLEIGCGSGAISISLLKSFVQTRAVAVDISKAACQLTKENAQHYMLNDRLTVINEKLFDDGTLNYVSGFKFDAVISNPPYLYTSELADLDPEIKIYEDLRCLNGGPDGLRVITAVLKLSSNLLTAGKSCFLEIRHDQLDRIDSWLRDHSNYALKLVKCFKDYAGYDRYIHVQKY